MTNSSGTNAVQGQMRAGLFICLSALVNAGRLKYAEVISRCFVD